MLLGDNEWTKLSVSISTSEIKSQPDYAQADRIKFVVQTKGATDGVIYFDSVRVVEKAVETSYTYDTAGNYLQSITNPLGNTVSFDPDNRGRVRTATDAKGKVTTFDYDNLDRLKSVLNAANLLTVYAYDNNGNLKTVTNKDNRDGSVINATASEYNALGLVTKVLDPLSRVTEYEYSESGKLVSTKTESGKIAQFGYDRLDRLERISYNDSGQHAGSVVAAYTHEYDANGNRNKVTASDGSYVRYVYDDLNQLTDEEYRDAAGVLVKTISYSYDLVGNRKTKSVTAQGSTTTTAPDGDIPWPARLHPAKVCPLTLHQRG